MAMLGILLHDIVRKRAFQYTLFLLLAYTFFPKNLVFMLLQRVYAKKMRNLGYYEKALRKAIENDDAIWLECLSVFIRDKFVKFGDLDESLMNIVIQNYSVNR